MKTLKIKSYDSCDTLPLWNFFKVSSSESIDVKYLVALPERIDYQYLKISEAQRVEYLAVWDKLFEEYNSLDNNYSVNNFINDRAKILYYYSIYLQESAVLKSLLYRTNPGYIRFLRSRGYQLRNTSNTDYWEDLYAGIHRVENHISYIDTLKAKIKDIDTDSKQDGNPYDSIMAWIAANDIRVEENITVSRYLKVKELINAKMKARKSTPIN